MKAGVVKAVSNHSSDVRSDYISALMLRRRCLALAGTSLDSNDQHLFGHIQASSLLKYAILRGANTAFIGKFAFYSYENTLFQQAAREKLYFITG